MSAKRRRSYVEALDDELHVVPSRVVARRRKARTRTITTLPDHMREQLIASFSNIDIEGIGRVNRYKLADIVREAYYPTDAEVANVESLLGRIGRFQQGHCNRDIQVDLDDFKSIFEAVAGPSVRGLPLPLVSWAPLHALFNTGITQLARHGKLPTESQASNGSCQLELYSIELQTLLDTILAACNEDRSFFSALVRQAFSPPRETLDQLATLFNSREDDCVELQEFIRAMTLLHGDMRHLVAVSDAPPLSKSPLTSPSAEFVLDGSEEFESSDHNDTSLNSLLGTTSGSPNHLSGTDSDEYVSSEASCC